jgi:polyhydroxyalkanoate synthesis regulator phasin
VSSYERPTEQLESEAVWRGQVTERLRSIRRALAVVGVLAVAALGVGLWALLAESHDDRGRARVSAVRALQARVDRLESEVRSGPSQVVVSIRDEQRALGERVAAVEHDTSDALAAIDALRKDVDDLQQRVDALEQIQQRPTTPQR